MMFESYGIGNKFVSLYTYPKNVYEFIIFFKHEAICVSTTKHSVEQYNIISILQNSDLYKSAILT